jgi:hypothetical protein
VALVYFAGHGIELDQQNWLLPVDAQLDDAGDVARGSSASGLNPPLPCRGPSSPRGRPRRLPRQSLRAQTGTVPLHYAGASPGGRPATEYAGGIFSELGTKSCRWPKGREQSVCLGAG